MIRRPPRSTQSRSSAASDVYKRQGRKTTRKPQRIPSLALVFDCETRTDLGQRLTVGFAVVLRSDWRQDRHEAVSLICFADEAALSTPERLTIETWLEESLGSILERIAYVGKH